MAYLSYLAQALVAVVFMWAGAAKLHDIRAFARYFRELQVLPSALSGPAARGLAIVELGVGGLAAVRSTATIGLGLGLVMLLALNAGVAVLLRRGSMAECACFGRRSSPLGVQHLVRNGLIAVIAAAGLAARTPHVAPPWPGIAIAVAVGVIGAVLIVSWDDIADLLTTPPAASKGQPHAVSRLGRSRIGSARRDSVAVHVGDPAPAAKPR